MTRQQMIMQLDNLRADLPRLLQVVGPDRLLPVTQRELDEIARVAPVEAVSRLANERLSLRALALHLANARVRRDAA